MAILQTIMFARFSQAINTDWNTYDTLVQAAATNIAVHEEYAGQLVKRMQQRPEFKVLVARSKAGTLSVDETQAVLDRIAGSVLAALPVLPQFSRSLLRAMMVNRYAQLAGGAGLKLPETGGDVARMLRLLESVAQTPATSVEQKTGSLWLEQQAQSLPERIADEEEADRLITALHKASRRLDLLFAFGGR
jgi:hypothetical protein